jgi:hypothetical protein
VKEHEREKRDLNREIEKASKSRQDVSICVWCGVWCVCMVCVVCGVVCM